MYMMLFTLLWYLSQLDSYAVPTCHAGLPHGYMTWQRRQGKASASSMSILQICFVAEAYYTIWICDDHQRGVMQRLSALLRDLKLASSIVTSCKQIPAPLRQVYNLRAFHSSSLSETLLPAITWKASAQGTGRTAHLQPWRGAVINRESGKVMTISDHTAAS